MIRPSEIFFEGGPSCVLLVHGLTGTPNELRSVAHGLNRAGYTVLCAQLAGHCGDVHDLIGSGVQDWVHSVEAAARRLLERSERIFVGGLSMGALLALRYAVEHPDTTRGLALYGTTFFYDGWAIPRIARLSGLLPLVDRLGIGRRRMFLESHPYGLKSDLLRRLIFEKMQSGDSTLAGLPGNPWPSLAQFQLLSRWVRRNLHRVGAPCLAVHASDDDVASIRNVHVLQRKLRAPIETVLLTDSYHMITLDQQRHEVIERSAAFFARHVADASQPDATTGPARHPAAA